MLITATFALASLLVSFGSPALAQSSRLNAFRLLVTHGETGLAAGEIARQLDIPHNTLSSHLSILSNAGLVSSERRSRSIIYRVDFEGMRELLAFLKPETA